MGREKHWGGRSSNSKSNTGVAGGDQKDTSSFSGCMSAVFQFFDFHQFQLGLHHQQPSFNSTFVPTIPKGIEAPRNSLESHEVSLSYITRQREEEKNLDIQMGIQIKTSGHTQPKAGAPNDFSPEISNSPGTKTPNLVARLMGLDLLPETQSPSSFSSTHGTPKPLSKSHSHPLHPRQPLQCRPRNSLEFNDITGTCSLPETPRISSARRSDVDHHHRLSLQINKENMSASDDLEFSRFSYLRRRELRVYEDENNRSPSQYARQIVKQMKEKVSRKVGLDITNTIANRDLQGRNELVSQFKSKKASKEYNKVVEESSPGKQYNSSTPSCSPRLRFFEPKSKPSTTPPPTKEKASYSSKFLYLQPQPLNVQPQPIKVSVKPKPQTLQEHHQDQKSIQKSKKSGTERFNQRLKKPPQTSDIIRNKQEEPFVRPSKTATRANIPDKKSKKTPLSSELLNINVPTRVPVKKDPSPPATNIPQKQVFDAQESKCGSQLSSCSSQEYKQEETHTPKTQESSINDDRSNGVFTTVASGAEYHEYVTNILSCTGIDKGTIVSFSNWFSPSHPLDPSILHQLEHSQNTTTSHELGYECNRKLLFNLVDEILVEILKPYINMKPWAASSIFGHDCCRIGSHLIDTLCEKIGSFPRAKCCVLEDIDGLVDKDLKGGLKVQSEMAFEEEGEGIVMEIEKDILDTLMHEMAMEFWCSIRT